jgi:hypothetical protein
MEGAYDGYVDASEKRVRDKERRAEQAEEQAGESKQRRSTRGKQAEETKQRRKKRGGSRGVSRHTFFPLGRFSRRMGTFPFFVPLTKHPSSSIMGVMVVAMVSAR